MYEKLCFNLQVKYCSDFVWCYFSREDSILFCLVVKGRSLLSNNR